MGPFLPVDPAAMSAALGADDATSQPRPQVPEQLELLYEG
jgi:hypothetical protein